MKNSKKIMAVSMATAMTLGSMSTVFALDVDGTPYSGTQVGDKYYSLQYIANYPDQFEAAIQGQMDNIILDINGNSAKLMDFVTSGADDFDIWAADPANQTAVNPTTLVEADGSETPISTDLAVVSVSAINGTEVTVVLANVPAELPAASTFQVKDSNDNVYAVTNIAAITAENTYKLTLGTEVTGKGTLTVSYGNSEASKEFDTTLEGLTLSLDIADEDASLKADGAEDTTITIKVVRDGVVDESFEGSVKFQSLQGATFAKEKVVFDKGVASVQLISMSSAKPIQDTIIATIAEAPQDITFVGTSIQANISYVPEDGNQQTGEKVFVTYAESDRTSDVFVKFNKDIDFDAVYADWKDNSNILRVSDDKGSTFKSVQDLVKVNNNTIKLVLMEGQHVSDNKEILVKATNSGVTGTLIDSEDSFNLVDNKAPEALSVSTPDYRTVVAKFTEPVSKAEAEVVGNWVLNGHQLAIADVDFVMVGKDTDNDNVVTQPGEIYTTDGDDYRNFVTIRLTSTGAAYLKKDANGNPKMNLLQAYDMIDYAGLTDTTGQNKATTQEFTFMTPAAPAAPTATVVMDSPEQYRVIFSTEVQTQDGNDLNKDHFTFEYQDKNNNPKNADGTINYAGSIPTLAAGSTTADGVVVTKISAEEYLLELNRDWTEEIGTDANNINYFTPDNNNVKITVNKQTAAGATSEITNFNEVGMAENHEETFNLALDDIEPVIATADQVIDTDGTPLKKVKVVMSEAIQMVDNTGASQMTANATASQYQGAGGVPVPTYEFVSEDLTTTIEGQLVVGSLLASDTEFEIEPVDPSKLTAGKWTVYVRSISDDIGNTSATEKYEVEIKATEDEKGKAQIIWADAHDNADLDDEGNADSDIVHIQFGTEMSLDVLKSTIYTIDGNNLPTGVKVTSEEVYYDSDNNGSVDTTGATDLKGTLVTITLPHTFLGDISDDEGHDIDSVDPDDASNQDQPHMLNISGGLTDAEGNAMISPTEVELTYTINGDASVIHHYDVYGPDAPVVTSPTTIETDGIVNATEATDVEVSGTAEAGSTVDVVFSDGTTQVDKQVTAAAGNWTLAGGNEADVSGLTDGNITITVTATDVDGNVSVETTETVILDTVVAAPVADAVDGFVTVAGDIDADNDNDTLDVQVGSSTPGTTEAVTLEYKVGTDVEAGTWNADTVADGNVSIATNETTDSVVFDEVVLPTVASDKVWLRTVDAAGNKSAWTDFGGDK